MRTLLLAAVLAAAGLGASVHIAHAQPPAVAAPPTSRPDVVVQVNGMVCDFCARGLEKAFNRTGKVSHVTVDLTAKEVRLTFAAGAGLDDAAIRKLIKDAGYAVVGVKRPVA